MIPCKSYIKLKLNTAKDIEETRIRLVLNQDDMFKLEMLVAFRPNASLRSINNTRMANLTIQNHEEQQHVQG